MSFSVRRLIKLFVIHFVLLSFMVSPSYAIFNATLPANCVFQAGVPTCVNADNGFFQKGSDCKTKADTPEDAGDVTCNATCARGFQPACSFTGICRVYGLVINLVTFFGAILALLYLMLSVINYVNAKGVIEEIQKAQSGMTNALIGLIFVIIAYTLTRTILTLLGIKSICF